MSMNVPPPVPTDTSAVAIDPHVKITLHDIYGAVLGLQSDMVQIKNNSTTVTDHETRIRALERWIWRASGIAAALGAAGGTAISQIMTP